MASEDELFTRKMRKATREIHAISDALVNAKLAFALSSDEVWADGLLVFYEVFRYLDDAMIRLSNTYVGQLCIDGMKRTEAFEHDLNFYLKSDWKIKYKPRESVIKYLIYLQQLEKEDPNMLMAYIYHLYMGLLSGGQILKKKREFVNRIFRSNPCESSAVTDFGNLRIYKLKQNLAAAMNRIAHELDKETKSRLIEESKNVFLLNNELIKSVRGANQVIYKKLAIFTVFAITIAGLIYMFCA